MITTNRKSILLSALTLALPLLAPAASLVTYAENPDQVNSTLSNTKVFDFNTLATGVQNNVAWDGVGSFNQLYVHGVDQYGGAVDSSNPNGSRYSVQGVGTTVTTTTLSLGKDSAYFGFWWSAGDASNVLRFYNDGALVQEFTTASLLSVLPEDYFGNPRNRSLNTGEPYAFINFYGDAATKWDSIVFTNLGSSGFESDNYTTRVAAYNPTTDGPIDGTPVAIIDKDGNKPVVPGSLDGSYWESSAPGAPAPPLPLILAFGIAAIVKFRKGKGRQAA